MKKVYIFGHRNPDTDSVTASIALAYLKRELGMNAVPAVLSPINLETKYALNYFKEKEPIFLNDVKLKVKDLNYIKNYSVTEKDSISDAYHKMAEAGISKIPIVDDNKKLLGIISMKDIAKEQFSENIDHIETFYNSILKTINGKQILKYDDKITGKLTVASYCSTTILNSSHLNNNTILIVGDRHSVIEYAIKSGVKLLIITGNHQLKKEHLAIAKTKHINIISTPYTSLITTRKINLANKVSTVEYLKDILSVKEYDNVSDFLNIANKTRYSYYPVLNEKEKCTGILRVSDVNYDNKKNVILVDHNSYDQSAIGLEETNIMEIIDHHNIGRIGTNMPINFRNMPLGSSNTIIYILFKENHIEIPKKIAGLMLSGILSDTLILNSPTTTEIDKEAVTKLAKIANIDYKQFGLNMLRAGSSVKGKTKEEILYTDYKNYPVGNQKIGLGQLSTTNPNEVLNEKDQYIALLNNVAEGNDNYFVAFFITDVVKNGSYVLYSERGEEILKKVYKIENLEQGTFLPGVVSRKKQILPGIMIEMGE